MNKLLSLSLLTLLALLTACQQDPQSANQPSGMRPLSPSTPAANPAIVYVLDFDSVISKKLHATYGGIWVMNADASNITRVITAVGGSNLNKVKWSHDGTHIVYIQSGVGVRRADISVVNGVPKATNITTIAPSTSSDSIRYTSAVWSPDGNTIALTGIVSHTGKKNMSRLWTIPSSGGSRTVLYSKDSAEGVAGGLSYSSDGGSLAFVGFVVGYYVRIVSTSTGASTDSLFGGSGYKILNSVEWSRSGADKLVYHCYVTSGTQYIKMFDLNNRGAGEVTLTTGLGNGIENGPSWSPDNSKVIYYPQLATVKPYLWNISSGTADSLSQGQPGNWKP